MTSQPPNRMPSEAPKPTGVTPPSAGKRPKTLGRLPLASDAPATVPARMINEVLYCERLMYLEWVQGEFEDNAFTVEGRVVHARVDKPNPKAKTKAKKAVAEEEEEDEGGPQPEPPPYSVLAASVREDVIAQG